MLLFKTLHIIFVVTWFAGLFYSIRLFIYWKEAQAKDPVEKKVLSNQLSIMTHRLWYFITWPSAILATTFGVSMLLKNSFLIQQPWMHIKLLFVLFLWAYMVYSQKMVNQIKQNSLTKSAKFLRIYNELPSIILIAVVFLVIYKNTSTWVYGIIGFFLVAILIMIAIRLFKNSNKKTP